MTGPSTGGSALLVLEDGRVFRGEVFGAAGTGLGEVVFATGMTGYQETLTDPSYHRQIVVQTAPQIGNTGWNDEDDESAGIQVAGYVVRDPSRTASNWRSRRSLADALREQGDRTITLLDGDVVRRELSAGLGFGKADRDLNVRRIGWVAAEVARHDDGGTP